MLPSTIGKIPSSPRRQRGVATLLVALSVLVILTIIILSSSNVALFEQKTATNENREMLATQASEYALNIGGEYLKANVVNIASNEDANGWLSTAGANLHWQSCSGITDPAHPCSAERSIPVRSQLYYYTDDGNAYTTLAASLIAGGPASHLDLPAPTGAALPTTVGAAAFPVTVNVRALLCRLDTTPGATPSCLKDPSNGNRVAITLVASSTMAGESSAAKIKESWGTFNKFSAQASVPLVAAGIVKGLGNASIVAAPNGGGYGLPVSVWSPNDVDVSGATAGLGSVSTCHMGDYLGTVPVTDLETTCAGNGNTGCGCKNVSAGSPDMLSGHFGGTTYQESLDILDVDGGPGGTSGTLPDITFFPGKNVLNTCMDDPADATDDNLFEWIFGSDVNGTSVCDPGAPSAGEVTKENTTLDDLGATVLADCSSLNTGSSGLYRITGACDLKVDVGTPKDPVVVVTDGDAKLGGNINYFGMLMVRDIGAGASLKGTGSSNFFGSIVVDGDVDVAGGLSIVYVETTAGLPGSKLPPTTRFARLPGSWLDSNQGF